MASGEIAGTTLWEAVVKLRSLDLGLDLQTKNVLVQRKVPSEIAGFNRR
jgi:hypothetical protein